MIKFALVCGSGHEFESWFRNGAEFDRQTKRGLIACPQCDSLAVSKAIMAPSLARGGRPNVEPAAPPQNLALIDERERQLRNAIRQLRQKIEEQTDDVGREFPDEARRMQRGDVPQRSIRGQASLEDAQALIEDGIDVMPIPTLPEDRN
jgi:hypothetical protein